MPQRVISFLQRNAPWLAAGMLLTFASSFGQTFFISVFAGEIMREFSLTDGQWGSYYSLGTTVSALCLFAAGGIVDQYRVRQIVPILLGAAALMCVVMANVRAGWMLPFVIFGLRFTGQGMMSHLSSVAMARWFTRTRGKAVAISSLGFSFGEALLPIVFVALLVFVGWRHLWMVAAGILIVIIPILRGLLTKERTPQSFVESEASLGLNNKHWRRADVLNHGLFWLIIPALTASGIFITAIFFQQVHFAESKGWGHTAFVALFPVYTVSVIAASLCYGWAIDRYGARRILPLFPLAMVAGFIILHYANTIVMAAVGMACLGAMQGGSGTVSTVFWAEFYGTKYLGSVKSLGMAFMVFGSAIGPALSGLLIDAGINFNAQLLGIAGYVLLTSILAWLAMRLYAK